MQQKKPNRFREGSSPGAVHPRLRQALAAAGMVAMAAAAAPAQAVTCARTLTADVVTIDMPIVNNRLGASNVNGMMYALRHDVVPIDPAAGDITALIPSAVTNNPPSVNNGMRRNAKLRDDKRPRPLVLRVAAGDCLDVKFQNLVSPTPNAQQFGPVPPGTNPVDANGARINVFVDEQVGDRRTSFHASGMQLRADGGIANDGSYVGRNASSLMAPGASTTYKLYAEREGVYQIISHGALVGSDANQGNTSNGLFGQVIVEPKGAAMYRNILTEEELRLAADANGNGLIDAAEKTPAGQPKIDYEARYPTTGVWAAEGKGDRPIVNMIDTATNEIWHTEVDAVIAYGGADGKVDANPDFPASTYPLESTGKQNPSYPNRLKPFRDFAQVWHDEVANAQAFPGFYKANFIAPGAAGVDPLTNVFAYLLKGVRDKFMINYASGGIGTEILANRLGVGPMHDCLNCAYEEFFLTHFTVGEVGQLVDIPANFGLENVTPQGVIDLLLALKNGTPLTPAQQAIVAAMGPKATKPLYPGDPANINHSYVGDHIKFRNTHNGFEQHVFHLHNHQWLFNPNDDNSNYLDAQGIGPGMGYTYEIAMGGSGNRNKSAGDAIYHCHFYPHFAQGMWYMWRIHDVYETGTPLQVSNGGIHTTPFALQDGTPAAGVRALPDGELMAGTPIPAVVPLPGKALPPMPSSGVSVIAVDRNGDLVPDSSQAVVDRTGITFDGTWNPGYPFWVAGIECGTPTADDPCPQGTVGQRPPTPPMDMLTQAQADQLMTQEPFASAIASGKISSAQFKSLAGAYTQMHGGLPRHTLHGVAAGGKAGPTVAGIVSPVDLTKFVEKAKPNFLPEGGTDLERAAMAAHGKHLHASYTNAGTAADFELNGRPPVPGAAYADPCRDDAGNAITSGGMNTFFSGSAPGATAPIQTGVYGAYTPRLYRGTNIQYDAVLNKVGYHYPQQRIVSLWEDALPVIEKNKPGEPLVMRLNTFDCAMYHHTNLVPETYEMDDYQVRTPTDIIGQHIHLPKWDLSTTDGAANGWNYEDGTIAAGAIRERIHAVNLFNDEHACAGHAPIVPTEQDGHVLKSTSVTCPAGTALAGQTLTVQHLEELPHPFFGGEGPGGVDWRGSRITLQRWFADPVLNTQGHDRGLGIIFTHDHYGPSTFQQIGLYSTVLIEPARSTWAHAETGNKLGCNAPGEYPALGTASPVPSDQSNACRADGGPTSWQAIINTAASSAPFGLSNGDIDGDGKNDSFREFYFEYTDFQHAYEAGVYVGAGNRGEYNGQWDEAAYVAPLGLDALFYPHLHEAPAPNLYPAGLDTFRFAIAPPLIVPVNPIFPDLSVELAVNIGNGALAGPLVQVTRSCIQRPCPTAIDFLEPGLFVVNYRNEPVGLRIYDPNKPGPDAPPGQDCSPSNTGDRTGCGAQADKAAGDLALALSSGVNRKIPELNRMPQKDDVATPPAETRVLPPANMATTAFPPHINSGGFAGGDPFTPMLRTYSGDKIRVKAQAGGDEEEHSWSIHGIKWLQGGSGHGRAPNSGWRNQQAGGISEQFTAYAPIFANGFQRGRTADYLYMMDAHQDGFWTGNWGIVRNYDIPQNDLAALPSNPTPVGTRNTRDFRGGDLSVCPKSAPLKQFNVSVVPVNDVLPAVAGVTVVPTGTDVLRAATPDGLAVPLGVGINTLHAGAPLNPAGGTLVYNARNTPVRGIANGITVDETGPLHDPTGIMYVLSENVNTVQTGTDPTTGLPTLRATGLKPGTPVEPLVLRVNAGDCVQVILTNLLQGEKSGVAADLPNYNELRHSVKRNRLHLQGSTTFQNNLVAPSNSAGFHLQLLEYDISRSDGTTVGLNPDQTAKAGGDVKRYGFYAGDLAQAGNVSVDRRGIAQDDLIATPVEFGGANILPADRVKQVQKGLFGQIIVEPQGATWAVDAGSNASATVTVPAGGKKTTSYRDFGLVWQKMMNYRYASGNAVQNESEEGPGLPENPPHTTLNAANYRAEPTFFRFGIPPLAAAGGAGVFGVGGCGTPVTAPNTALVPTCFGNVTNAGDLFSNTLTGGADPQTPIFTAPAGSPFRIHLVNANSSNRGATFTLHGHVWPRDPYLAQRVDQYGFPMHADGTNLMGGVGSVAIGNNPMQMYFGAQESIIGSAHFSFVLPSAGGVDGVTGDYLFRDTAAAGMGGGAWGILRVQ